MNDVRTNLEGVLLGYYIKYDRLFELSNYALKDIETNTIDIYVDLYDMLKPIYTAEAIYANKARVIPSSIINLAAHYRGYYRTRHRLHTRIFLVFANELSDSHTRYVSGFGDTAFRLSLNFEKNDAFVQTQLELIKILAAYIPDVYYISSRFDFATVTAHLINSMQTQPPRESILITKSKYAYQVPAYCYTQSIRPFYVRIFRPKKYNKEDTSYVVDPYSAIFSTYDKIKSASTLKKISEISPCLLGALLSMTGLASCNVPMIINTTTAVGAIHDALQNMQILNGYNSDPVYLYSKLDVLKNTTDVNTFMNRFFALDIANQVLIYESTAESKDTTWNINLNDPKTVQYINNQYFIDNPLDLNNL